jgi:two-component sensor histidine kinase
VVAYEVGEGGWMLSVTDNGVGRAAASPQDRVGLGTEVVKSLARQLHARVEVTDAQPGSRTTIVETRAAAPSGAAEPVG